jgi:protein-tyrosine phosphatase
MAKVIFDDMVAKSPQLRSASINVRSAGTLDMDHHEAGDKAIQVMNAQGLDLTSHRSRHIDQDLVDWSDIILVMEEEHREYILDQFAHARNKVKMLTELAGEEGNIPDPIGQGIETYRQCAWQLTSLLRTISGKMAKGLV